MESLNRLSLTFSFAMIAAALIALGTAYTAQYMFGYDPCILCLYQRIPYAIIGVIGIATLFFIEPEKMHWVVLFTVFVLLASAGIAFYHVGVEQKWWISIAPCGGGTGEITTTDDLLRDLQGKPPASCSDAEWTLFGVSMATYNVSVSLALAGTAFSTWRNMKKAMKA